MNQYFEFYWHSGTGERYVVQTDDPELMDRFLFQHGFMQNRDQVYVVHDDPEEIQESFRLVTYTFGSKKRDQMYKIVTCEDIMVPIIEEVGDLLASVMTLGACALLGDIEIFSRILSLVEELDFIYVVENQVDMTDSMTDFEQQIYTKSGYPYYEDVAMNADDSYMRDCLYDASVPQKEYQAITVEAYVRLFTDMFIIGRKVQEHGKSKKDTITY